MRTDAGTGCPVCAMDAAGSGIAATHLGVIYRFCSAQCRENFQARPRLYVGKGALKAAGKRVVKRRRFMLARPAPDAGALEAALTAMMGVDAIEVSGTRVTVAYDLLEATAAQIEHAIEGSGAGLAAGWASRLKRGWLHHTEQTELENLAAGDGPCCNRPPHG